MNTLRRETEATPKKLFRIGVSIGESESAKKSTIWALPVRSLAANACLALNGPGEQSNPQTHQIEFVGNMGVPRKEKRGR